MGIVISYYAVYDVINFEINYRFLIKTFFYMTKQSAQKCKYLKNEKHFLSFLKGPNPKLGLPNSFTH